MIKKRKILVILGPTATGKSRLGVKLARKFNGEIISADSRQVYRGLDIGSGKITKKEMGRVPHHLLDIASPKYRFTVVKFKEEAEKALKKIVARKKLPIIVGGTGFYIEALIDNVNYPAVLPNPLLRRKLAQKSTRELFRQLKKLDPRRAQNIDPHNKVRLIRAVEIARALGKVPKIKKGSSYNPLFIGIDLPDQELKKKISIRLFARISRGMIAEVRKLRRQGVSWKRLHEFGLEYRYTSLYLGGSTLNQKKGRTSGTIASRKDLTEKLQSKIWHFAKRQRTWFRRDKRIKWFESDEFRKIAKKVSLFLRS